MIGEMDIMKWCIREILKRLSIPSYPVISNVLAVVRLQADREEDEFSGALGASLSFTELWRPLSPKQQEIAKPTRLELKSARRCPNCQIRLLAHLLFDSGR